MLAKNPGGYDTDPRGVGDKRNRDNNEVIPLTTGQELQPGQGLDIDKAPE